MDGKGTTITNKTKEIKEESVYDKQNTPWKRRQWTRFLLNSVPQFVCCVLPLFLNYILSTSSAANSSSSSSQPNSMTCKLIRLIPPINTRRVVMSFVHPPPAMGPIDGEIRQERIIRRRRKKDNRRWSLTDEL